MSRKPFYVGLDLNSNDIINCTLDANGTGNTISNLEIADFAASSIVTEAEGISSNDNDTTVPTSAAVKDYADSILAANDAMIFQGGLDASGVNELPAGDAGDTYKITTAGDFNSTTNYLAVGDTIICTTDSTAANTPANWIYLQTDLEDATETSAGTAELATQTETDTGTDDTRIVTPLKLVTHLSNKAYTKKYSQDITTTADTPLTVTHNLGTTDIVVQVKNGSGVLVTVDVDNYTSNSVDITSNPGITSGRVIITG